MFYIASLYYISSIWCKDDVTFLRLTFFVRAKLPEINVMTMTIIDILFTINVFSNNRLSYALCNEIVVYCYGKIVDEWLCCLRSSLTSTTSGTCRPVEWHRYWTLKNNFSLVGLYCISATIYAQLCPICAKNIRWPHFLIQVVYT